MTQSVEAAMAEVMDRLPGLMYERSRLRKAGIDPTAVLLPARLNVPYDGDDATDFEGSCMGLPIVWSEKERWGLVVMLPEPKARPASAAELLAEYEQEHGVITQDEIDAIIPPEEGQPL